MAKRSKRAKVAQIKITDNRFAGKTVCRLVANGDLVTIPNNSFFTPTKAEQKLIDEYGLMHETQEA